MSIGWNVKLTFQISLHSKDLRLLEEIKTFFGVGSINSKHGPQTIQFRVTSIEDIAVIISHFDKFPLLTQKRADYVLFKEAFYLIKNKEHLTMDGLNKIVALKASGGAGCIPLRGEANSNLGLSDSLKGDFPYIIPIARPLIQNQKIIDPNWLAGFTSAEGCFFVSISNSLRSRTGSQVLLEFSISQHARDEELITSFIEYLGCGKYRKLKGGLAGEFKITKFSDLTNLLIPFFQKFPILGEKSKDFLDYCKVAELMRNKVHTTSEDLNQIQQIKAGMNKERIWS